MTTAATTTTGLPSEAIVRRADEEIAALARQRDEAGQRLQSAQEELEQLTARRSALEDERQHLVQREQQAHTDTEQVRVYASLAAGSVNEASAIASLKEVQAAEKAAKHSLETFEKQAKAEESQLVAREPKLAAAIADDQHVGSRLAQREQALQVARSQAFEALGAETFDAALADVHAAETEVNERAAALVEARLALAEVREEAELQLRPWADLHRQAITEDGIYEDATTRMLGAYVSLLDVLEQEGPQATPFIHGYSLAAQIELVAGFVEAILKRDIRIGEQLRSRRAGAQQLLHMHLSAR